MKPTRWPVRVGACLLLGLFTAVRGVAFVDPLDEPAQSSALAASTQLLTITRAGERLVAAGPRGHILYSEDDGKTWTQAGVPVSVTLTALSFPTPEQGWAVGHSGVVLHSSDGGATWVRQLDGRGTPAEVYAFYEQRAAQGDESAAQLREELTINWQNGAEQPWLGVWFENDRHGFVVGPFDLILETDDGGQNWTPWMHRVDNPKALHFNAITAIGDTLYLPSELGLVFRLQPGEASFIPLQTPYSGSFFGLCGDERMLLAYGLRGTVYASLDAGDSWELIDTGVTTALTACTAAADGGYLLAAISGQIIAIRQEEAAVTTSLKTRAPWPLMGLTTASDGVLVAVGLGGIWRDDKPSP